MYVKHDNLIYEIENFKKGKFVVFVFSKKKKKKNLFRNK